MENLRADLDRIHTALGPKKKVDIYEVARVDPTMSIEEIMKNLVELKEEGHFKVSLALTRYLGLSVLEVEVDIITIPHHRIVTLSQCPTPALRSTTNRRKPDAAHRRLRDPPNGPPESPRRPPDRSRRDRDLRVQPPTGSDRGGQGRRGIGDRCGCLFVSPSCRLLLDRCIVLHFMPTRI